MNRRRFAPRSACLLALGMSLLGHAVLAAGGTSIMPLSQVKVGMKGYGLTSLGPGGVQKFQFEVVGLLRGWSPKGAIVLIKMQGPVIDQAGTIAGMSGSPVYIDGKLLGAVALGWYMSKVPLAGVRPAEDMLKVRQIAAAGARAVGGPAREAARERMRRRCGRIVRLMGRARDDPARAELRRAVVELALPPGPAGGARLLGPDGPAEGAGELLPAGAEGRLRPLPIPMAVSGAGPGGMRLLSMLRGSGLAPVQAPAAVPAPAAEPVKLAPGVPVGAVFISGDMDIAAMGTATVVDGQNVLAFGHPMFGTGPSDYPLAVGRAVTVVPTMMFSFRLSSTDRVVGRIVQDRSSAIMGRLGEEAPMFPLKVRVRGSVSDQYNYRVAGYWMTAPFFAFYAAARSSLLWEDSGEPLTVRAKARISVDGLEEPLVLSNVYASDSVLPPSLDLLARPMSSLLLNPFKELHIEAVEYEVEARPGSAAATIESVRPDRARVAPGEELALSVRLRPYRAAPVLRKVRLKVPPGARPGTQARIIVCSAPASRIIETQQDPGLFAPRSLEGLLERLRRMEPNTELVVRASFVRRGVRFEGQAMPALPPSALGVLSFQAGGDVQPLLTDVKLTQNTPWVLEGTQNVTVQIKEPGAP